MDQRSLAYATYWRLSLSDAELSNGALKSKDIDGFRTRPRKELDEGCIGADLVEELFAGKDDDVDTVNVTLRPLLYRRRLERTTVRSSRVPEIVTPIVSQGCVDRDGRIHPNGKTFIPRDILEPLDHGAFSIGTVDALDKWLQAHQLLGCDRQLSGDQDPQNGQARCWQAYRELCRGMIEAVAGGWPDVDEPFEAYGHWLIVNNDNVSGASKHILSLYDHLREDKPTAALFERYACETVSELVAMSSSFPPSSRRLVAALASVEGS